MASGSKSATPLPMAVEESEDENDDWSFPSISLPIPEVLFELICSVSSRVYSQRCRRYLASLQGKSKSHNNNFLSRLINEVNNYVLLSLA